MGYTPGPWQVTPFLTPEQDDDPMMVYHVHAGDLQERFDNLGTDENDEFDMDVVDSLHAENAANAQLIAAAPDLLAALERLQSVVRDEYHLLDIKKRASLCLADAQAGRALAKAKGQS